ncbi:MAG TPA: HYR domain-containing protein, partial [Blastocatellia bacterium]|nr:HYR domain-containing protein [Blastocatellia bacterium]
ETITIDATTQPGFSNSPIITLDGGGLSIDGLVLTGGSSVVRGLAIHNLGGNGILLGPIPSRGEGAAAPAGGNSFVEGNYIGLDSSGTGVSGVGGVGVLSTSIGNTIGGGSPSSGNVIALTGGDGVDAFFGDVVQSNLIGTDATGVTGLGGSGNGVIVSGSGAFIGGVKGSGNVIASQSLNGIEIRPDLNGVIIQGNSIGTDDTGSVALGNLNNGINLVDANGCMIGSSFGGGNLISGNGNNGIVISGASAVSNSALNNLIGVQGDGTSPLGNGGHGILIDNDASSNTIGGLGFIEGNVIAFNGGDGISVDTGTGNALRGNSIFSNTGLGIDLSPDGVTPNDLMDGDTGPNNLQNFPVLTSATLGNGIVTIQGTFNSTVDSSFVIDFYVSPTCDQSGNGEGQMWLGSANVITDASGNATINELLMASVTSGDVITATATSSGGSTSEFSACVTAGAGGCVTFDNDGGDGLWQNQLNWSGDQLPGAGDNACIPSAFTVTLSSGAQSIAGLMNDGTLIISGGDLLISAASTSNNLTINSGSMLSIGDTFAVSGNMTIAGGNVTGGGTLAINSGAVLNITSGASFIGVTVNNSGTTNWTNPGSIFMDSGAVFNNLPGGLFHAQNEGVDVFSMGGGAFNNSGEFRKSTSTGSVSFAGGVPFNNSGTVDVQLGTLSFGSGYTQTAGNLLLNGGDLSIDGTILIQGGALSGSGTINGSVSNGGQVNPGGSPGIINIAGDYTQTSTGVLNIEIGGLTAGTQYDRLIVGGIAMLDGTLNLMLINSFSPNVGDTFQVLNYMSLTGSFATINGLNIGGGRSFQPSFNATDLTFAVVGGASSDLSVTKTGSPDPVAAGGNITYTIQVSNSGPDAASTVQLDEAVPANTTFQSITAPPGWSCSTPAVGGTGAITCTTNLLPVLSTANFTLVVRVDPGTADNTIITNTATVTSSITDPAPTNNTAGATTTVMTPPCTNICPADMSVNADPAQCGAVVSYTVPPGSGNCGTITCSPAPGSFFPVGVTVVTCMATVGTSCSFNVTVIDNQRPRVTCPGNITTSTTTGSTTVDYVLASATDNCSGATVICVPPSGTVFPLGVNTVNCSATDSAGNTSTCTFTITVNDGRSPTINCPPNVIIEATAGQCAATVTYPDPVVTDPASTSVVIACVPPSGSTFPLGATTVICSATNQAGNRVSCSFTVLVNAPPQIRVTLEGGGTSLQPGPVDPPLRQRDNPPASCDCDSTFTIENTGCSPFTLTLSEIARTGADVDSGRITNTDDGSFFSVRLVAADQSETRLSTGSQVSFDAGQRRTFRLVFNPVIPAFTGRTTNLSASNALPNPVTSRIVFNQGGASPLSVVIPISGRVSTGVRLLNPDNSRDTKRVIFTRSGNEFTVSLAVFDSNQDVNLIRYEFLDGQGRTVDQAFDIDMTDAIRQSNIIRGQSFKVIQRFTGANSRLQITSVRVTVFDAGSNDTFTAQLQGGTTSSAAIRSVFGQGTLVLPDLLLGGGARKF